MKTRTYSSWAAMKQRCLNRKNPSYPDYGGSGIKICKRWLIFANFLEDMGERPAGTTIDRKNRKGNYTKRNCRWATWIEQQTNRSIVRFFTYKGESLTIPEWGRRTGFSQWTLWDRYRKGWSVKNMLTKPRVPNGSVRRFFKVP